MTYSISHSEADSFTTCERRHFYTYGMKLQPKEGELSDALYTGILGHIGMAVYFKAIQSGDPDPLSKALNAVVANRIIDGSENSEKLVLILRLLKEFHGYRYDEVKNWQILEVEQEDTYAIVPGELETVIYPDLVAVVPEKPGITVIDHKFQSYFTADVIIDLAPQLPKYIVGRREKYGSKVRNGMYNEFKTYMHKEPRGPEEYFRFTPVELTPARIVNTFKEHIKVSERIHALKILPLDQWEDKIVRTANGLACKYCDFAQLCTTDLNDRPRELMIQTEYQPRKPRREKV